MQPFQREKFQVPGGYPDLLKSWTREVLKYKPQNIIDFSVEYFRALEKGERELEAYLDTLPPMGLIVNPNLKNPYYPDEVNHLEGGEEVEKAQYATAFSGGGGDGKEEEMCNPGDVVMYTTNGEDSFLGCCVNPADKSVFFFEDPNEEVFEVASMRPVMMDEALSLAEGVEKKRKFLNEAYSETAEAGLVVNAVFGESDVDSVEVIAKKLFATCFWVEEGTQYWTIMENVWYQQCEASGVTGGQISIDNTKAVWMKVCERVGSFLETQVAERLRGQ